jgi:probable HAF family extracellular repeat protein
VLTIVQNVRASGPTFTTIDYPGAPASFATDINDSGQVVGEYQYGANFGTQRYGYLFSGGVFTPIIFPGSLWTRAVAINRYGDIVGDYAKGDDNGVGQDFGYLLRGGEFTSIRVPDSDSTIAAGINANGDIVGWFQDKTGMHGFLLSNGVYTAIDFPGSAASTQAWKINDSGEIAGRYRGATDGKFHMFVLSNGTFTAISDVPGAFETAAIEDGGLSNAGHIVSHCCTAKPCTLGSVGNLHGFLLSEGLYKTFDFPGAVTTLAFGINSADEVAGGYIDSSGVVHGYLRTP